MEVQYCSIQGRIQSKFEGGAVDGGGAKKIQKLVTRVRCIQPFQTLTTNKRLSIYFLKKFSQ